jgi:E3 ubiquitin-protein ligase RNF14
MRKRRKPKTHISPSELLQIPIEHDIVKRYVTLKHKAELESDKNTIYCPRKWCQGAARSKKHRKPADPLNAESSEEESEQENKSEPKTGYKAWGDLLAICEDCSFAFCSRCFQGWHGEFTICSPRTATGELTEEDKASLEYLKLHTTPCPTCAAPAQKTHGCNHMICFRCNTHFCYLCSAWLEPTNPYQHYNDTKTGCYMRLWELEGGDGDDVGIGFAGGVQPRELVVQHEAVDEIHIDQPIIEVQEQPVPVGANAAADAAIAEPRPNPVVPLEAPVAREGPLVLRIGQVPPRPAAQDAQPAPQVGRQGQPANRGAQGARRGRGRGAAIVRRAFARRDAELAEQARLEEERIVRRAAIRRIARAEGEAEMDAIRRGAQVVDGRIIEPARVGGGRARPLADAVANANVFANALEEAHMRWVQNFVNLALNDQEDQIEWDSDDEEDPEAWRIPER